MRKATVSVVAAGVLLAAPAGRQRLPRLGRPPGSWEDTPVVPPLRTRVPPWGYPRALSKRRTELARLVRRRATPKTHFHHSLQRGLSGLRRT